MAAYLYEGKYPILQRVIALLIIKNTICGPAYAQPMAMPGKNTFIAGFTQCKTFLFMDIRSR